VDSPPRRKRKSRPDYAPGVTTWHAETPDGLEEVSGVIHDAWFDIDGVRYDETTQVLIIPFAQEGGWGPMLDDPAWRDAPKPELVRTSWRYRDERVPFVRGTLRITAVESVTLDQGAGDAAMLLELLYDSATRRLTVEGVSGDLVARVHRLDVTAELVNEVALYVRRRHGLLGVSDSAEWVSSRLLR